MFTKLCFFNSPLSRFNIAQDICVNWKNETGIQVHVGEKSKRRLAGTGAQRVSALLRAMSNPHRLVILCHLLNGEANVSELERVVGLSQSALSQHLARLRQIELVRTRRHAQQVYYSLNGDQARTIIAALCKIEDGLTINKSSRD